MRSDHFKVKGLFLSFVVIFVLTLFLISQAVMAEEPPSGPPAKGSRSGWSTFLQGGYVHQFDTDIDSGGSFSLNRLFFQGGVSYGFDDLNQQLQKK